MSFVDWLKEYEHQRIIFMIVFVVLVAFPFIYPIGLPIITTKYTVMFYDEIENIAEDDTVIIDMNWSVSNWGELGAGAIAMFKHLNTIRTEKPFKLIILSSSSEGPLMLERVISDIGGWSMVDYGEYGTDWVDLGYMRAGPPALAAMAEDFNSIWRADYQGTPVEELPLMMEMNDIDDVDLVIHFNMGGDADKYRTQWSVPYNKRVIEICQGIHVPSVVMYIKADQIQGMIGSVRGAAEYELLVGEKGEAVISTDALSMGHLMVLIVVILGNIVYFKEKFGGKETLVEVTV